MLLRDFCAEQLGEYTHIFHSQLYMYFQLEPLLPMPLIPKKCTDKRQILFQALPNQMERYLHLQDDAREEWGVL